MDSRNLTCVKSPVAWLMIPGLAYIIWSIKFMAPGLVSDGFLVDPPECLSLVLHGILWYFPKMQATQGGISWPFWTSWVLSPSWIFWGGIWNSKSSACVAKPVIHSCPVPKGPRFTTDWTCPPSWARIIPHICPPPPSWLVFVIGSWSGLGGLLLPPGSCIGLKYWFYRCLPREPL